MLEKDRDEALKAQTQSMTEAAQKLNALSKKRREVLALIREKEAEIDSSVTKNVNAVRQTERNKKIQLYGEVEDQRQQVTSSLMLELMQICEKDEVPRYIAAIAKVLDNYQGELIIINHCPAPFLLTASLFLLHTRLFLFFKVVLIPFVLILIGCQRLSDSSRNKCGTLMLSRKKCMPNTTS